MTPINNKHENQPQSQKKNVNHMEQCFLKVRETGYKKTGKITKQVEGGTSSGFQFHAPDPKVNNIYCIKHVIHTDRVSGKGK